MEPDSKTTGNIFAVRLYAGDGHCGPIVLFLPGSRLAAEDLIKEQEEMPLPNL